MRELSYSSQADWVQGSHPLTENINNRQLLHQFLLGSLPDGHDTMSEAAIHHFQNPGKMLRGLMAIRAGEIFNIEKSAIIFWAAAIETLHNASLVHDDICDGHNARRGSQSVWSKFGRNTALMLGDALIATAFDLASKAAEKLNKPQIVSLLAQRMSITAAGQAREFQLSSDVDWKTYDSISADKTSPLLTAPLEGIAVIISKYSMQKLLNDYFRLVGIAYQISNDILNFVGSDGANCLGSDMERRSPNAVVLTFKETLNFNDSCDFKKWYLSGKNEKLKYWIERILDSKSIIITAELLNKKLLESEDIAEKLLPEFLESVLPVRDHLNGIYKESVKKLKVYE